MTDPLTSLNAAPREQALTWLAPLVENAPWVAQRVVDDRPFPTDEALAEALVEAILAVAAHRRLALFRAHPELAGREAAEGRMTLASVDEQDRLGLLSLSVADHARLSDLNAAYAARFGHPFIVALHRVPDLATLFATFEHRLRASPLEEHVTTLAEITSVIRSRAARSFGPGAASLSPEPQPQE